MSDAPKSLFIHSLDIRAVTGYALTEYDATENQPKNYLEYRLVGECPWTANGFSCGYLEMYDTGCGGSRGLTVTEAECVNGMHCICGDRIKLIQQTTE